LRQLRHRAGLADGALEPFILHPSAFIPAVLCVSASLRLCASVVNHADCQKDKVYGTIVS